MANKDEEDVKLCKYCNEKMEKQHTFSGVGVWVCVCGYREVA